MKKIFSIYTLLFLIAFFTSVILSSCRKTEYEQVKRPYNNIEQFIIKGYGDIDSINAVLRGDTVIVYWNVKAERPLKIRPQIVVSEGATVLPASGEEISFADTTVFKVTAEDGTVRSFYLKPVLNQAIPVLSYLGQNRLMWVESEYVDIVGQYFLSGGDTSAIKVHAQRISDGFEFEMPLIKENVTQTNIRAAMPEFTSIQDTGWHKIWVKVGDAASDALDAWLGQPYLRNAIIDWTYAQEGQEVHVGDELTIDYSITDNYGGNVAKFYNQGDVKSVFLDFAHPTEEYQTYGFDITEFTATATQIKFKIPAEAARLAGWHVNLIQVRFPFMYGPNYPAEDYFYANAKTKDMVLVP